MHYKTIVLNSRPLTDIEPDTFRTETHPRSELKPGKGEALVQCTWLSLDPAMRGYIRDTRSYLPPVKIGEVCHILVGEICCAMVADITAGDACCWPWCGCGGWTREQVQRGWSCKRFMGCVSFLFIPYYISLIYLSFRYDWIRCYERQKSGEDCVCLPLLVNWNLSYRRTRHYQFSVPHGVEPLDFLGTLGLSGIFSSWRLFWII